VELTKTRSQCGGQGFDPPLLHLITSSSFQLLTTISQIKPQFLANYYSLARQCALMGDKEQAFAYLKKAPLLRNDYEVPRALYWKKWTYLGIGT